MTKVRATGCLKELAIGVTVTLNVLGCSSEIWSVSSVGPEEHSSLSSVALKITMKPPVKSCERSGKYPSERTLDKILLFLSVRCSSFQGQPRPEIATKTHCLVFVFPLLTVRRKLSDVSVFGGNENIRIGVRLGETWTSFSWLRFNLKLAT